MKNIQSEEWDGQVPASIQSDDKMQCYIDSYSNCVEFRAQRSHVDNREIG